MRCLPPKADAGERKTRRKAGAASKVGGQIEITGTLWRKSLTGFLAMLDIGCWIFDIGLGSPAPAPLDLYPPSNTS